MKGAEPRSSALKLLLLIDYCLNMAKNPIESNNTLKSAAINGKKILDRPIQKV